MLNYRYELLIKLITYKIYGGVLISFWFAVTPCVYLNYRSVRMNSFTLISLTGPIALLSQCQGQCLNKPLLCFGLTVLCRRFVLWRISQTALLSRITFLVFLFLNLGLNSCLARHLFPYCRFLAHTCENRLRASVL